MANAVPLESPRESNTSNHDRPGGAGGPPDSVPTSSQVSSREGPPKIYEEIIQGLEADVRKHIRIEQQLKLHIETVEGRLDELESDNEKLVMEC